MPLAGQLTLCPDHINAHPDEASGLFLGGDTLGVFVWPCDLDPSFH